MALDSGTKLGPYEILSPLGAGGMGEVYKAKDTRLDRTVAIKILPEHLAESPERKERFEREAKVISQLNHPHICTLHDVGSQDGTDFLVMEHIEGETLAEKLKRGALPLDKALEYGIQIADGLERAHRQGVVHRDLKPGNIMLTRSGVKLLDFGLAKLVDNEPGVVGSDVPTQQKDLTQAQAILGTLAYMAPEQLEAKNVDNRTDLFALGAVLYEMLTGVRAFQGESQASLISAIMTADPKPVSSLRRMTPPALDHVVRTCLAKDPEERWQAAGDVARQLKWIGSGEAEGALERVEPKRWSWLVPALILAFAFGVVATFILRPTRQATERVSSRFDITLRGDADFVVGRRELPIAMSRDGRRLVYGASDGGTTRLFLRDLGSFDVSALNGTEGASYPFFSPNGRWVGFHARGSLWKVSVEGGAPIEITRVPTAIFGGAVWLEGDVVVFSPNNRGPLHRVSADGGETAQLTTLMEGERLHGLPTPLPGGKDFLFSVGGNDGWYAAVASRETGRHRRLVAANGWIWFLPSGYLVYGQRGSLFAAPFDLGALEVRGGPTPVLDNVLTGGTSGMDVAYFAIAESGSLVYVPGELISRSLVWVNRDGSRTPLTRETGRFTYPSLSPRGDRLAVTDDGDIWVYDLEGGTRTRLTTRGANYVPRWSPDGRRIVFGSSQNGGQMSLHEQFAEGGTEARLLLDRAGRQYPQAWTSDGEQLLFLDVDAESGGNIMALAAATNGSPTMVIGSEFREWSARLSPDGQFLAYTSNATGRNEIYVKPYPGPGPTVPVSAEGGTEPLWSPDGRELFYWNQTQAMVVDVRRSPTFSVSPPRVLFEGRFALDFPAGLNYDITPDGERFVMIEETGATASRLHVITNWNEEVKRRVQEN